MTALNWELIHEMDVTREFINDARERRSLALNGKSKDMSCDHCEFQTSSKTLLTKHIDENHQEQITQPTQEMRIRLQCDKCDYKTTSKDILTRHIKSIHEGKEKSVSKRKVCTICGKRFNKNSTFNTQMKNVHKEEELSLIHI